MAPYQFIVAVLLTSLPLAFMGNPSTVHCPQLCSCSHDELVVDCSRTKFSKIPPIPLSTQVLTLDNNPLGTLGADSFSNLTNIRHLSLQNCQLSSINQLAFSHMTKLTTLVLAKNKLRRLPKHLLSSSEDFETLIVSDNQLELSTLAPVLIGLHSLQFLDITNNIMDEVLPVEFSSLRALTTLKLGDSGTLELPAFYFQTLQNTSLSQLVLAGSLGNISQYAVADLISLQVVDLSGVSVTSSDAANLLYGLSNATMLNTLTMNAMFNKVKVGSIIHKHFFQPLASTPLKTLSFQANPLAFGGVLQHKVFKPLHSVINLYLDGCSLYEVRSDSFHGLTHMRYLSLRDNLLTCDTKASCGFLSNKDHTSTGGLATLEELDLSYNDIRLDLQSLSFRKAIFPKLQKLYLNHNKITHLHGQTFEGLPELYLLDLSRNPISDIASGAFSLPQLQTLFLNNTSVLTKLPARLCQGCHKLTMLNLAQGDLNYIDPEAFKGLRKLEQLYLTANSLSVESLANVTLDSPALWKLDLGENMLTSVPLFVTRQTGLTHLFMDMNYISDDGLQCLWNNTDLEVLDLSYNAITHICDTFIKSHSNLRTITLEQNPFVCDCSFQGVGELFNESNITVIKTDNHVCSGPPSVKGHNIFTFTPSNWNCRLKGAIIPLICVLVTLLLCGLVVGMRMRGCERPHVEIKDCCNWDNCYFRLSSNMETTDLTDNDDSRL